MGPKCIYELLKDLNPSRALRSFGSSQIVGPGVITKPDEAVHRWNQLQCELKFAQILYSKNGCFLCVSTALLLPLLHSGKLATYYFNFTEL